MNKNIRENGDVDERRENADNSESADRNVILKENEDFTQVCEIETKADENEDKVSVKNTENTVENDAALAHDTISPKDIKFLYLKLFWLTFYVSLCTFGGGFVIISILKKKLVEDLKWLKEEEMLNFTAIAQSSPGPMAINTCILIGNKMAGFLGSIICIVGTVLPPLTIISLIAVFYQIFNDNIYLSAFLMAVNPVAAAIIFDVVLTMLVKTFKSKNILTICIFVVAFVVTFFFKINVVYIIISALLLGIIVFLIEKKRGRAFGKPLDDDKGAAE